MVPRLPQAGRGPPARSWFAPPASTPPRQPKGPFKVDRRASPVQVSVAHHCASKALIHAPLVLPDGKEVLYRRLRPLRTRHPLPRVHDVRDGGGQGEALSQETLPKVCICFFRFRAVSLFRAPTTPASSTSWTWSTARTRAAASGSPF